MSLTLSTTRRRRHDVRHRRWHRASTALTITLVLPAILLTGCGRGDRAPGGEGPPELPTGSSSHKLSAGGTMRKYHVYRPKRLHSSAALVVMIHGGFGSGQQAQRSYGWDAKADAGGFIVAYPDGTGRAWSVGGGCCGRPGRQGIDDVGFITAMVRDIQRGAAIDPKRIYATGISNGGFMSYRLACQTTLFAAIGPDAATMLGDCPSPAPTSVIHVHGTADSSVRYEGGRGDGPARVNGPAVPKVNATWREIDDCAEPESSTEGVVTTSTAECPQGRAVTLITIDGAGHQWPGATKHPGHRLLDLDPPSTALDATDAIWRFFSAHPKP